MTRLALALALVAACRDPVTVSGIPEGVTVSCNYRGNDDTQKLCTADEQTYICVCPRGDSHWTCEPLRSLGELE